ncbi:MAG TPA: energy transducer TonB [Chitinophagaceae bacterium]|nr:energy transducer TonB [Chitinophagaceae bacterium]
MKRLFAIMFCTAFCNVLFAQKRDAVFYIFKTDWTPAKNMTECVYFMQPVKEDDTTFICRYYQKLGPMVKQESYFDSGLSIPNGKFFWFNNAGNLDSTGYVTKGRKDKRWYVYVDSAKAVTEFDYDKGTFIKKIDLATQTEYYPDGTIKQKAKDIDTTTKVSHVYVQAKYPGGVTAWQKYLVRNLQVPNRFSNIIHTGSCAVTVGFIIDKEGKVAEIEIYHSCEWSADNEALRVIKKSANWVPASIDGRKVLFRQRQSLTFSVN